MCGSPSLFSGAGAGRSDCNVGLAALNALAYALLADRLRAKIARPSVLASVSRFSGSALVAMSVATAAFRRA